MKLLFSFIISSLFFIQIQSHATTDDLIYHYIHHRNTPSDINEHLPLLEEIAKECESAIEIGVREAVSSWGVLKGLAENGKERKEYLGIDLNYPSELLLLMSTAEANGITFDFWKANDMEIEIPETDFLFIDSLHTYCHLTYELETFASKVKKYIAMHDTSDPWGNLDDECYTGNYSEYPEHINRTKKGLWPAVIDFLKNHPEWKLKTRQYNNHGFTILERKTI